MKRVSILIIFTAALVFAKAAYAEMFTHKGIMCSTSNVGVVCMQMNHPKGYGIGISKNVVAVFKNGKLVWKGINR